ncbi:MAG: hypothetical protein ACXVZ1_11495 [Gaiellaceae bacterium]
MERSRRLHEWAREDGFVLIGGPLGDGSSFLLVLDAEDESAIRARAWHDDPWTPLDMLRIASIEPWTILLGEDDGRPR